MEITSQEHAHQVIAGIPNNEYGAVGSPEREEAMNALRAYRDSTLRPSKDSKDSSDSKQESNVTQEDSSFGDQVTRGAGLTARGLAQGVAGLAGIVNDPLAMLMNYGLEAAGAPKKYRFHENLRQLTSDQLTDLGLPSPETGSERISGVISEGVGGGGLVAKLATLPTIAARSPYIAKILSSPYEVFGAGAAGGGSQYAAEKGAGPVGQVIAGIGTAISAPLSVGAVKGIANTATYFTNKSAGIRAGRKLVEATDYPELAIKNLENAEEIVPGSQPTAGPASAKGEIDPETGLIYGDAGLLQAEAILRANNPNLFSLRLSQQNAARRAYLQSQIDELGDPETMRLARDAVTAPMREESLRQGKVVNIEPVLSRIDGILQSARGTRDAVKQSLPDYRKRLQEIKNLDSADEADRLYELRKDMADDMRGSADSGKSGRRLAKAEIQNVMNALDDAIEEVSPGYKAYLEEYHRLSQRVNQAERLIIMRDRALGKRDPLTGQEMFSQAKFRTLVLGEKGKQGMSRVLTDDQLIVMTKIADDLDRAMTITSPQVKAAGSDTARNTVGNALGTVVGDVLTNSRTMRLAGGVFDWVGKLTKAKQQELIIEAMLDPKLAAILMRDATRIDSLRASRALWDKYVSLNMGAMIGIAASEDPLLVTERQNYESDVADRSEDVPKQ